MTDVSQSVASVMKPAGLEKSKGVITAVYGKDPTDARWKDDAGMQGICGVHGEIHAAADLIDAFAVYGFDSLRRMVQVLKQCGDDLSRENIMRQAANLKDLELPMLLPGIKINTSPDNYSPIRQMQLARFNGAELGAFGEVRRAERKWGAIARGRSRFFTRRQRDADCNADRGEARSRARGE